jgi:mannose-6-phosphate isomerase-like protein (cupin superfamily)
MHIPLQEAIKELAKTDSPFQLLFEHGTLSVELYQPDKVDLQQPHSRDEVYIVAAGEGAFYNDGTRVTFSAGDFLFVKAGKEHRFEDFSEDFLVWVIFYGPEGGEQA